MRGSPLARFVIVLGVCLSVRAARAGVPSAEELFAVAEAHDAALRFAEAGAAYEASSARDPSGPRAARAEARAAEIRKHAEGDYRPLARVEAFRRDPAASRDPAAVDALVRDAETFPAGLVRVEVWMIGAEAYAARFGRPDDAAALWARVLAAPEADPVVRRHAARERVALALARGDREAARRTLAMAGPHADDKLASDVDRAVRRHRMHFTSLGIVGAFVAASVFATVRVARAGGSRALARTVARSARVALVLAAWVGLGGGILAGFYEGASGRPFFGFGAALALLLLVARAWGAAGAKTPAARAGRAAFAAASVFAIAFLILETVDGHYLAGLGL